VIRRSPCERYLKYLITHPDKYSNEVIRGQILLQQLDHIGDNYLEHLRTTCVAPAPFYPENEGHRPSSRFLISERLVTIYRPDDVMHNANQILATPKAKETIETLMIAKADDAWIAAVLARQGYAATPEAVERYGLYYFDLELVDSTELKILFELRGISPPSMDPAVQSVNNLRLNANKSDPRRLSSQLASPALAGIMHTIRLGYIPSSVELGKVAASAASVALHQTLESLMRNSPERGRDFSIVAKNMMDILTQTGSVEDSLQEELQSLALETEATDVPHVGELGPGTYTLDVQPLEMGEVNVHTESEPGPDG
jgi:hypothetical protein